MLKRDIGEGSGQWMDRAVEIYARGVSRALVQEEPGYVLSGLGSMVGPMVQIGRNADRRARTAGHACDPGTTHGRKKGDRNGI